MRRMALAFPFQHSFFGLTPSYKPILHDEIFALIYHSHGGFNWSEFKKGFVSVFKPFSSVMSKVFGIIPGTQILGSALGVANSLM